MNDQDKIADLITDDPDIITEGRDSRITINYTWETERFAAELTITGEIEAHVPATREAPAEGGGVEILNANCRKGWVFDKQGNEKPMTPEQMQKVSNAFEKRAHTDQKLYQDLCERLAEHADESHDFERDEYYDRLRDQRRGY